MYEASKDGLFRVDRGAGNNPEFEETRRVFATKMAKIHLQQQQQLLQEEPLPRGARGLVHGGGRLGLKLAADGAAKPPLAASAVAPGVATTVAPGQPVHPASEQRAGPCVPGPRPNNQERTSREGLGSLERSAVHQPGPCEDPSCLTHGDYYDNLSPASPTWGDKTGASPSVSLGAASRWPGPLGSDLSLPRPSGDRPLYQPQLSFDSGLRGQDANVGGPNIEKRAGLWSTAASHRVSPLLSPGLENGAPAQPRSPLVSAAPDAGQGVLLKTNLVPECEALGVLAKSTVDAQPWFRDGPKSYLSSSALLPSPASTDVPGPEPKHGSADPDSGSSSAPLALDTQGCPPCRSCHAGRVLLAGPLIAAWAQGSQSPPTPPG